MAAQVTTPSQLQRALFANVDSRSANHSLLPYSIWTSRIMYSAQALAFPLAFWFKPACLFFALVWLTYRAYQVLNKPLEELASLLGFDIPFTPIIDLAGVKADGAIIHWSLPEKQKHRNTLKYEIHINGNVIDTVSLQESAVSITGLQPGAFYVVRVALVNSLEFSSKSSPVRFRTKLANSGDYYSNAGEGPDGDLDGMQEVLPHVKPYRGLKDFTPASPDTSAPMMTRENSSGGLHKRSITGRRPSPVALGLETRYETAADAADPPEGAETIQQLTQKLDAIRHETDEAEKLAKEDEEDELRQKEELILERDQLRAESSDKDKANRELKRQINQLERQNTAAQNERSKHERLLQQKKQEREKLKEDSIRWEQEAVQLKEEVEKIKQQKVEYLEQAASEKELLLQQQQQEAADVRSLDEEIRLKAVEIKKLDRAARNGSPNGVEPESSLVQQFQQDAEDDRAFQMRRYELQHQYAAAVQNLERTKNIHATQVRFLESVRAERRRTEEAAAASAAREYPSPPPAAERGIRRGDSQRSRHTNNDSPRMTTFPPVTSSPFGNGLTSTGFSTAPFLNIHNGMTITRPSESLDMSEEERDRLTGGAPMSPGAGAELIPADLFSNDDNRSAAEDIRPLAGLGALPGLGAINLPGLGAQPGQQEFQNPGPASPTSPPSRAGSLFASPRVSQNNLPTSPDNYMDSDRRSVHSTRSSRAISNVNTGSRFSSMFGMKPRLKNSSMDESIAGPALGKVQSQSMPRQDQGIPGLDSASRRRNSSISGPMFGDLLGKDGAADAEGGAENTFYEPTSQPRRRAFNLNPFSKDKGPDGWPSNFMAGRRPASPRPGSTHSSEFPRPSLDSSRWGADAWPSNDSMGGARASPLSLGGWNAPGQQSRIFGSRHPSRRPSVQHGASGPPEDIMEDEDSDALDAERRPHLAPIGTKPPPGSKQGEKSIEEPATVDPKLNPNAKDFKNFFSSIKLSSKDKEKLREIEASSSQTPTSSTPTGSHSHGLGVDDDSPPASRKSRDARSTTTIESSVAESLRNSMDLARTPSYSNASETASNASPMLGSGSFGKESFIAKLQRKSSSGMWNLPTFKRDKSRLEVTANEDEEEALSASASSLGTGNGRESKEAQRGSRSWSNALKLGKKKGGETPSVSGLSITSGADEEEGR
jgi:hypothetical protein